MDWRFPCALKNPVTPTTAFTLSNASVVAGSIPCAVPSYLSHKVASPLFSPQPGMGNADDVQNDEQRYREGRNQAQEHTVISWD